MRSGEKRVDNFIFRPIK